MATIRRLSDADVRAIFESLHGNTPPPGHLKFEIVPVGPNGLKLSPPSYEFEDGLYVLLRPEKRRKATGSAAKKHVPSPSKVPSHLVSRTMKDFPPETCPWSLSGPQFPQPTAIQQRYCYPKGEPEYSSRKGGALWTMYGRDGKEDLEFRLLHVYFSAKRAVNKGVTMQSSPKNSSTSSTSSTSRGNTTTNKRPSPSSVSTTTPKRKRKANPVALGRAVRSPWQQQQHQMPPHAHAHAHAHQHPQAMHTPHSRPPPPPPHHRSHAYPAVGSPYPHSHHSSHSSHYRSASTSSSSTMPYATRGTRGTMVTRARSANAANGRPPIPRPPPPTRTARCTSPSLSFDMEILPPPSPSACDSPDPASRRSIFVSPSTAAASPPGHDQHQHHHNHHPHHHDHHDRDEHHHTDGNEDHHHFDRGTSVESTPTIATSGTEEVATTNTTSSSSVGGNGVDSNGAFDQQFYPVPSFDEKNHFAGSTGDGGGGGSGSVTSTSTNGRRRGRRRSSAKQEHHQNSNVSGDNHHEEGSNNTNEIIDLDADALLDWDSYWNDPLFALVMKPSRDLLDDPTTAVTEVHGDQQNEQQRQGQHHDPVQHLTHRLQILHERLRDKILSSPVSQQGPLLSIIANWAREVARSPLEVVATAPPANKSTQEQHGENHDIPNKNDSNNSNNSITDEVSTTAKDHDHTDNDNTSKDSGEMIKVEDDTREVGETAAV